MYAKKQDLPQKESLVGTIDHIRFSAVDTGYCVFSLSISGSLKQITAVGVLPEAKEGLQIEIKGEWKVHPKFGKQLAFSSYSVPEPTTKDSMIAYLATLKCCGEKVAEAIWDTFGEDTLQVFDYEPHRLIEVPGIGKKNGLKILESFQETRALRKLIAFLSSLSIGATYATRIFNKYGDASIGKIKTDPYILAEEVHGIGFKKADEIARGLKIAQDSDVRLCAGILFTLKESANQEGHCYLSRDRLITKAIDLLKLPGYVPTTVAIDKAIALLELKQSAIIFEDTIWLSDLWSAEIELAGDIKAMAGAMGIAPIYIDEQKEETISLDEFIEAFEGQSFALHEHQKDAIAMAAAEGFSVLTGGPGTGKSSVSKAIVELWHQQGRRVILAAPTGKAAKRLAEATKYKAGTIHRLLGWSGTRFEKNRYNQLDGDAFLIDESSMINLKLFKALIEAIPRHAQVVIVGDVDQLPAIGAGNVLSDLINCGQIPVTRLTHIFRQGTRSTIAQHCRTIREGHVPTFERMEKGSAPQQDCVFLQCDRAMIPNSIQWLISEALPEMGAAPDDIQILAPMKSGDYGCHALNSLAQNTWKPGKNEVGNFRKGDRVIQLRNDYDKKIFNGDIGKIAIVDQSEEQVITQFDDPDIGKKAVEHSFKELDQMALAYALTIHKSQGSEFPVVIIPVTMSHFIMLQRNLLYTAISRGRTFVVLVGEQDAIAQAIRTAKVERRNTMLTQRIA